MKIVPRDYQEAAISAIVKDFSVEGNSVVCLPTGSGKSIVIAEIASRMFPKNSFVKNSNHGNINT